MAKVDLEKERERLTELYSGMQDGELQEIAVDADALTDVARATLRSEILHRGMAPFPEKRSPIIEKATPPPPVVIRRYRDLGEASIAKSVLDSAGIESFLSDDNVVRMDWLYSNLIGGIKLLVREEDAASARKLLEQEIPEKFIVEGVGEYEQPRCPNCESLDVSFEELDRKVAYPGLFFKVPIPATLKGWNCHSCGQVWGIDDVQDRDAKEESKGD